MVSSILLRIGIGVIAATVLAAVIGLFLPSTFAVEKAVVIKAAPAQIHQFAGDLARWPAWTPWLNEDPDQVVTLSDLTSGAGARLNWTGGSGGGELVFTRSDPDWGIAYEMTFKERTYTATGSLEYHATAGSTQVVWKMTGDNGNNILARYFAGLMPSLIGPQFEEGLARLKLISEKAAFEEAPVPEG
jgi:hypothetical protein